MSQNLEPVPDFLLDTLATMRFKRRAGEWDIDLGEDVTALALDYVSQFLEAFAWASFRELDAYEGRVWTRAEGPLIQWLDDPLDGFRAKLDLALYWEHDGLHESVLPDSGELFFERDPGTLTLTIWPNLFTDRVPIYTRGDGGFSSEYVHWPQAASRNRERLETSLRTWERLVGHEIVSWDTELAEGALGRHGFSPA